MTNALQKRKWAGAPVRELRKVDQDPAKVPPHKKERTYVLEVIETTRSVHRRTYRYSSKAAREQARAVMKKKIEWDRRMYGNWKREDETHTAERSAEFIETELCS